MSEDRFDGKSISDLGFSAERLKEIQEYAAGLGSDHGSFGYSANTEHHFKETDNPTAEGSIEADMRKIGEHLGYQHAGTLNHDKVKAFIADGSGGEPVAPGPDVYDSKNGKELSDEVSEAKERAQAWIDSGYGGQVYGTGEGASVQDFDLGENDPYRPDKPVPGSIQEIKKKQLK